MKLTLLAIFFALALFKFVFKKLKERMLIGKLPGPPGIPIIGQAFQFSSSNDQLQKLRTWCGKYGPRFKIHCGLRSQIILANAEDAQTVLSAKSEVDKGKEYEYFWPWIGISVLTSAGPKSETKRKMMEPAFHSKFIDSNNQLEVTNKHCQSFVDLIAKKSQQSQQINIYSELSHVVLKILLEITTGQTNPTKARKEYETAIVRLKKLIDHRQFHPWLYPNLMWRLSPSGREESRCLNVIHALADASIKMKKDERSLSDKNQRKRKKQDDFVPQIRSQKQRRGILDHLLDWQEKAKAPNTVSDIDLRDEINCLIFAGYEPTVSCIMKTLELLGRNGTAQEKVQEELEEVLTPKETRIITRDLEKLEYLEMCILETLRLHPSVRTIGREVYSDFKLDDQTVIPAGVSVTLLLHEIHRDPKTYPQPNAFQPERFADQNINTSPKFLPFSFGRRGCLGQNLALIICKLILAKVLEEFNVTTTQMAADSEGASNGDSVFLNVVSIKLTKRQ